MAEEQKVTRFIDTESQAMPETSSYDQVVLKQMQKCLDVLNKEKRGGTIKTLIGKHGKQEQYIEDVREAQINSVNNFRILLSPFTKDPFKEKIIKIRKEITDYIKKLEEQEVLVYGKGKIKIKDMDFIPPNHPKWKIFVEFKSNKYSQMFEVLINCYYKNKTDIERFSHE